MPLSWHRGSQVATAHVLSQQTKNPSKRPSDTTLTWVKPWAQSCCLTQGCFPRFLSRFLFKDRSSLRFTELETHSRPEKKKKKKHKRYVLITGTIRKSWKLKPCKLWQSMLTKNIYLLEGDLLRGRGPIIHASPQWSSAASSFSWKLLFWFAALQVLSSILQFRRERVAGWGSLLIIQLAIWGVSGFVPTLPSEF